MVLSVSYLIVSHLVMNFDVGRVLNSIKSHDFASSRNDLGAEEFIEYFLFGMCLTPTWLS